MAFKLGMAADVCMAYLLMLISVILTLMPGHRGSAKTKQISLKVSRQLSKQNKALNLLQRYVFFCWSYDITFAVDKAFKTNDLIGDFFT